MNEQQLISDLEWAVCSPSLIAPESSGVLLPDDCSIFKDDFFETYSDRLAGFMTSRKTRRVGYYFENLVHFWLEQICKFDMVAVQQQICVDNRTVGEVDFLYRDHDGQLLHLETAVKFYLHYPFENSSGSFLIGPNAADTFEKKMRRLFGHQLPLSEAHFPDVQQRLAFVKGRIFYHVDRQSEAARSARLAANHLRGMWLFASELERHVTTCTDLKFRLQRKPNWLAPDECVSVEREQRSHRLLSPDELTHHVRQHFSAHQAPLLFSQLKNDGDVLAETSRLFIVADTWPEIGDGCANKRL